LEFLTYLLDLFLHLDKHLNEIIISYKSWTYLVLFLIIFCETGLVFTPFLPGDSLLFAAGALAALGSLNPLILFLLLAVAAILGDTVNYWIGEFIGEKLFDSKKLKFLKREHLDKTHQFYEKHGGKTIIIARFVPIIRTFAPFVAGIGSMTYAKFLSYNFLGGILWVGLFIFGGYYFGNLPFVKSNFSAVILAIVIISVLPGVIEYLRNRKKA